MSTKPRETLLSSSLSLTHIPDRLTCQCPIEEYYRPSVIGGVEAFVMPPAGFESLSYALAAKLRHEVS
jgi:hypothetical protein